MSATDLTDGERAVLQALADGEPVAEICSKLNIERSTFHTRCKRASDKLGTHDRTHAVAIAIRHGIIR